MLTVYILPNHVYSCSGRSKTKPDEEAAENSGEDPMQAKAYQSNAHTDSEDPHQPDLAIHRRRVSVR